MDHGCGDAVLETFGLEGICSVMGDEPSRGAEIYVQGGKAAGVRKQLAPV